jgi:diadenosine tetraphosphate (Ap4A) HIT family hydrolase
MEITMCKECQDQVDVRDIVDTWHQWHVVINYSQNYLGKVMLVLKRHEPDVTNLTDDEQAEFWVLLRLIKESLIKLFQPDHFNYSFLMNQDRHVHLHVIPRYANPREFAGQVFTDGRLGDHYRLTRNMVAIEVRQQLAEALREQGLKSTE